MARNPLPAYMLRHQIQSLDNLIVHHVYYAEILRQRARNEHREDPLTAEATRAESRNYEECADRLRCAIACLLDLDSEERQPRDVYRARGQATN